MLDAKNSMLVEVKRDKDRSESGSAKGSAVSGRAQRRQDPLLWAESIRGRANYC